MIHLLKKAVHFFDKLEDHVRERLSRMPILYTLIGGVAIVLFWKGVWDTADSLHINGPLAMLISIIVLLVTGLFVSFFVGDVIILSGLKKEKKVIEKAESEIQAETVTLQEIKEEMDQIRTLLETHEKEHEHKK